MLNVSIGLKLPFLFIIYIYELLLIINNYEFSRDNLLETVTVEWVSVLRKEVLLDSGHSTAVCCQIMYN